MTKKLLIAGIAGGVVLFVWGVVSWMLLPIYQSSLRTLPGEEGVVAALVATRAGAGLYVIPGLPRADAGSKEAAAAAEHAWEEKSRRGPVALLVYDPEGRAMNRMFWPMARGLSLCLLAAFFSAWALSRARIAAHLGRILFVLGLGVFGWVLGPGMEWQVFGYPGDYTLATLVGSVAGWVIVGVVQAGIVRPRGASARPSAAAPA